MLISKLINFESWQKGALILRKAFGLKSREVIYQIDSRFNYCFEIFLFYDSSIFLGIDKSKKGYRLEVFNKEQKFTTFVPFDSSLEKEGVENINTFIHLINAKEHVYGI